MSTTPQIDPRVVQYELPPHLAERITVVRHRPMRVDGQFVLYWMRTAARDHDNPALDAAATLAAAKGLPLLVYHGVSERYPYASDRLHRFILEGARDVSAGLKARGFQYACHVERPGHRGRHLRTLAERCSAVVTEDMPTMPMRRWTDRLAIDLDAPVLAVDTACLVPPRLYGRPYTRAFKFRSAMKPLLEGRIRTPWADVEPPPSIEVALPFTPVCFETDDLSDLVAQCEIDHTVGPVPHTPGGMHAGYQRWAAFRRQGLSKYARRRNNPLIPTGVSRMSAYLHFGHVSPFRLAREVYGSRGQGAEKYLDELLTWRELAYTWCHYHSEHEDLRVLPQWAQDTWDRHRNDPRDVHGWERLARARTGDALWDACQRSLLQQGELHNNVRMTWGKAIAGWTKTPESTLRTLVDLNHRYALDGRDPGSYGGILWCMGLFDREFPPERPISGVIRPRDTSQHAERLDVATYTAHVQRPVFRPELRVAVIGAGPAGTFLARNLADHGVGVTVFDKGRSLGGRTATRRSSRGEPPWSFDFGAQYLSFRDPHLAVRVQSWHQDGVIAPWHARFARYQNAQLSAIEPNHTRWVGQPTMRAICEYLGADLTIRQGVRVVALERRGQAWDLRGSDGSLGEFDVVLSTAPAPQTRDLLTIPAPRLAAFAASATYAPCWAILAYADDHDAGFDAAVLEDHPLSWVARDDSKPGRPTGARWILHGSPEWSTRHLEDNKEWVCNALLDAAGSVGIRHIQQAFAHRWRYALVSNPAPDTCAFDPDLGLGVAGDWCVGPRVEAALQSAAHLTGRVLGHLTDHWGLSPSEDLHNSPSEPTMQRRLL